ncbi:MAG: hypothetical protein L0Z51_00470 [Candidatus Latescibacteria bacterium]|nr:hypothetical protein [Candidatus Latescibacterota bacterium]
MKTFLSLLWRGWKKFAHVLGIINTRILLTISYFVILAVASIITKVLGKDILDRRMKAAPTFYHPHEPVQASLEACRRQF